MSLLSPPYSYTAVKHGPCLVNYTKKKKKKKEKDPGFRDQVHEETSPYLLFRTQNQHLGLEQDQLPCGSRGVSSGNCQETKTCVVRACHTPRQPLQNHPSGHLWGWTTLWSAEETLNGQHQRVDFPVHAKTAHKGLLQKRMEEDLCGIVPHVLPPTRSVKGLN